MSDAPTPRPLARARVGLILFAMLLALLLNGCAPTSKQIRIAQAEVAPLQSRRLNCDRADHCAIDSPVRARAVDALARSTAEQPIHQLLLLEAGQDALLAQIHLIRAAQIRIDVQTFIFAEDDTGYFVLSELLAAAERGVQVRLLVDQLFSVDDIGLLARLSRAHTNFQMRMYNPTFGDARTGKLEFLAGILCCFSRFNHRMHNKLLLVDGMLGITGGRNYQNRYFDWDSQFNYRDRDVLLAGPAAQQMQRSFERFWQHRLSVPIAALNDVSAERHRRPPADEPILQPPPLARADRMLDLSAQADNPALIEQQLAAPMLDASRVEYLSDRPNKPFQRPAPERADVSRRLRDLLQQASESVLLQTPYLVFSPAAQEVFSAMQQSSHPPRVRVSSNSLAATDAFPVYALSHKYKRRYLRKFGFEIHEFKPFPASAPIDPGAAGLIDAAALGAWAGESRRTTVDAGYRGSPGYRGTGLRSSGYRGSAFRSYGPLPLRQAGMRIGLHAKSMVIDYRIAIIGTHNFDPRSDRLNTESIVVVHDPRFARRLAAAIEHDMLPENAWTIARRARPPVFSGLNYSLTKVSEWLPLFDIWPWRYSTSWEILPHCEPLPISDPGFAACYQPVGDFPEVELSTKAIYTRILTAFGAGLRPIL